MTASALSGFFVGREAELAVLAQTLENARTGQAGFVLIDGSAGIGKTALIDRFVDEVCDVRILRVSGDAAETAMPYAIVDQLLRQAEAVDDAGVSGAHAGISQLDPVAAGELALSVLVSSSSHDPVLLVVDDAQWVDPQSLRAVLFALRRLGPHPSVTVVAARTDDLARLPEEVHRLGRGPGAVSLHLEPFDVDQIAALASSAGVSPFPQRAARRLHEHTAGNPLHARALLAELPGETWSGPLSVLPAPRSFEAIAIGRLRALTPAARALLEAAAVIGIRCQPDAAALVADVLDAQPAIDEASDAGLVVAETLGARSELRFVHPLIQAAVYKQLSPGRRRALHTACAHHLQDEWARLRHRASAVAGSDAKLAAELDDFAARQTARGAWAQAAAGLVAASRVSATPEEADERLLKAVDSIQYKGDVVEASGYIEEIARLPEGPRRDCVLGFHGLLTGRRLAAESLLASAWAQCDPDEDPTLAATIARRTASHFLARLHGEEAVTWSRRALELAGTAGPSPVPAEMLALGIGEALCGRLADGLAAVDTAVTTAETSLGTGVVTLRRVRGWLLCAAGDLAGAESDLANEARAAGRVGSLGTAAFALAHLAQVEYLTGAWDRGILDANRAIVIASELQHGFLTFAVLAAALIDSARGNWDRVRDVLDLMPKDEPRYERAMFNHALALAHLAAAQGRPDEILAVLAPVSEIEPARRVDEPGLLPWAHLYADALVAEGRLQQADEFLLHHEQVARDRGRDLPMARLATVRGRLLAAGGDAGSADESFQRAAELGAHAGVPFDTATTHLAWGQVLRRRGQRREAAAHLRAASSVFATLKARPYRERCEHELQSCGLAPAQRIGFDRDRLTPQEMSVARLVASGLTNRQAAAELVLSVRTIEFHLTRIYAKLGITSRAQLAALASASPLTRSAD